MVCGQQETADQALGEWHADHRLMQETARRLARQRVSPEGREGVAAFLERRRPTWS